jgi:hypothetical protein
MRLKRATLTFAGAAAAVAITTMAASPAWACNDRDPKLQLSATCGANGQPNWMVTNPNTWGAVPFSWTDDKGGHSDRNIPAPAGGSVALPTHASSVKVVAYRPDKGREMPVWVNHGDMAVKQCAPAPTPSKPTLPPLPSKKPTPKPPTPSKTQTSTPVPSAPSGEARPATPVKAQPKFTG